MWLPYIMACDDNRLVIIYITYASLMCKNKIVEHALLQVIHHSLVWYACCLHFALVVP